MKWLAHNVTVAQLLVVYKMHYTPVHIWSVSTLTTGDVPLFDTPLSIKF